MIKSTKRNEIQEVIQKINENVFWTKNQAKEENVKESRLILDTLFKRTFFEEQNIL